MYNNAIKNTIRDGNMLSKERDRFYCSLKIVSYVDVSGVACQKHDHRAIPAHDNVIQRNCQFRNIARSISTYRVADVVSACKIRTLFIGALCTCPTLPIILLVIL